MLEKEKMLYIKIQSFNHNLIYMINLLSFKIIILK